MNVGELKTGSADQRGRKILDILWSTHDYVIYRHTSGVSPHFSDDGDLARKQRAAYSSIGPQLSKVNALRSATVWRAASIDREIARAIYQSLESDLKNAAATLDGVRARLENLINIQGRLLKTLTIDPDSDWRINAIAGASRIIIAVIGSIFVYLMIVAKLALTGLNLLDSDAGIYAISIAAGFSEKFVPNLLRGLSVEDGAEKNADESRHRA